MYTFLTRSAQVGLLSRRSEGGVTPKKKERQGDLNKTFGKEKVVRKDGSYCAALCAMGLLSEGGWAGTKKRRKRRRRKQTNV